MASSLSDNSQLVYRNALSIFNQFRHNYNLPNDWPSPVAHLTLFITFCFEMGYAPSTISTYLAGLGFHHKLHNLEDPTTSFVVRKLLEGCKRMRGSLDVRAPITETILRKISLVLPVVCFSAYEANLFKAAYLLAYFGLLRVSEIVYTTPAHAHRRLLFSDLCITERPQSLVISIRFSKTNQAGPPTSLRIPASADASLCPFLALKHYMTLRPTGSIYLFVHQNGLPLTRGQFGSVLAKAICHLGLQTQVYTSHSFRIGRASDLSSRGVSTEAIMKLGRWRSLAVKSYIRT